MDEQAGSVSPELLAANRRLYELRAQAQAGRQAAGLSVTSQEPPAEPPLSRQEMPEPQDVARTLAEKIAALPEPLGWGSAALTAVIRRQRDRRRERTADDMGGESLSGVASSAAYLSAVPRDDSHAVEAALEEPAEGSDERTDEAAVAGEDAGESLSSSRREQVKLYPDIGLGMLRSGWTAAGRLWLLLRHLDRDGQGSLRIVHVEQQLTARSSNLYLCGKRQLRNLLRDGEGLFWTREGDRIWLRSAARVAHALGVVRLTGRPVSLPVAVLLIGIGAFRAHLYAAFHSSRIKETTHGPAAMPISRATLARLSGVGGSSQRAYEARAGVAVQTNYAVGEPVTREAMENRAWQHGRALFEMKDHRGRQGRAGQPYLAWQLPNSYIGAHARRPKGRQKRINRQLSGLVEKGMPGNVERTKETPTPNKRYYPTGKLASRAHEHSPGQTQYWPVIAVSRGPHVLWHHLG